MLSLLQIIIVLAELNNIKLFPARAVEEYLHILVV